MADSLLDLQVERAHRVAGETVTSAREGPSGALSRGLAILAALLEAPAPLGLAELANATGLEQSTTLRLLRTLEEDHYVLRAGATRKYLPSPKALRPLALMHPLEKLRRESASLVQDVSTRLGKTVVLVLYMGTERFVVDIAQSEGALTPFYVSWLRRPLHCTAVGKACLEAIEPAARAAALGPEPYSRLTANTLTTWGALAADLARSRERGYFVACDEHREGLTAVAANFRSWDNDVAGCLAATGHTDDFSDIRMAQAGEALKRAAGLLPLQAPSLRMASQYFRR